MSLPPVPFCTKPRSSSASISRIVKASCNSTTSMELGEVFDILYASCAASLDGLLVVRSDDASLNVAPLVCCPIPLIHTGLSIANSLTLSSDNKSIAQEPSQGHEHSSNLMGSAILLECITSSSVINSSFL